MRIAVYTLTYDRIEYTQHCFKALWERAGQPFDHYVVDNGSTDGTVEWLKGWSAVADPAERPGNNAYALFNPRNVGNAIGNNIALDWIASQSVRYDLICRVDNDCEVVSGAVLVQLAEIYAAFGAFGERWIVSPRVEGIVHQPERGGWRFVGNYRLGLVSTVGGLFRAAPADVLLQYRWPESQSKVFGEETSLCHWFKTRGGQVAYAEDLIVNHYRGTDQQALDYPEYHRRKLEEAKESGLHPVAFRTGGGS